MKISIVALLAFVLPADAVETRTLQQAPYFSATDLGAVDPDAAAGNPMKGLMTSPSWHGSSYKQDVPSSLEFYYIEVKQIMIGDPAVLGANAYDWSSFETRLNESAGRKKHAIPRFFLHYPGSELAVPDYLIDKGTRTDGDEPDYSDPILLEGIVLFIAEFGARYDGDTRIAFIQMGIIGKWGEWHVSGSDSATLPDSTKDAVSAWYLSAFTETKLQTRYPYAALYNTGVGLHDDSFAHSTLDGDPNGGVYKSWYFWPRVLDNRFDQPPFWRTSVMGGETRPELQGTVFSPGYPAGTAFHQDFDLCVEITHATYMLNSRAFGSGYTGQTLEKAKLSSARMGYNFHVSQVAVSESTTGGQVDIAVTVTQVGVAPFYFPLALELDCPGLSSGKSLDGVDALLDEGDTSVFQFTGIPATAQCLEAVSLALASPNLYAERPVKFAQGNGFVMLSLPLPDGTTLPPSPVQVPTSPPTQPLEQAPTQAPAGGGNAITGFTLMDASGTSDTAIVTLVDGATVDLAVVGSSLSLRADTSGDVDDVTFKWNGGSQSEGAAPWAMGGNSGNDYYPVPYLATAGTKAITAKAYSSTGAEVGSSTLTFTVVNGAPSGPAPTNGPVAAPTKAPTRQPTGAPVASPTSVPVSAPTNHGVSMRQVARFLVRSVTVILSP
jgi:hypothetical protein